jgi:hypothetical protein
MVGFVLIGGTLLGVTTISSQVRDRIFKKEKKMTEATMIKLPTDLRTGSSGRPVCQMAMRQNWFVWKFKKIKHFFE